MSALIVPNPQLVPADYGDQARHYLATVKNVGDADDLRRRLAALRQYVTDRAHKDQLQAAECWCAIRIGELLGPGQVGANQHTEGSHKREGSDVDYHDRYRFRLLARYKAELAVVIVESMPPVSVLVREAEHLKQRDEAIAEAAAEEAEDGEADATFDPSRVAAAAARREEQWRQEQRERHERLREEFDVARIQQEALEALYEQAGPLLDELDGLTKGRKKPIPPAAVRRIACRLRAAFLGDLGEARTRRERCGDDDS
jgi:hypothetical protein